MPSYIITNGHAAEALGLDQFPLNNKRVITDKKLLTRLVNKVLLHEIPWDSVRVFNKEIKVFAFSETMAKEDVSKIRNAEKVTFYGYKGPFMGSQEEHDDDKDSS